ncbi:MAG TPA: RnfABCDGE type electron transport complex subunit G [Nitrospirota bacterium]|nr:RnfABCDGE type electron transport complex subunit G [Nitrospirota bacterium]
MKEMLKITLSLVAIFIAAGLIMGITYKYTSPVKFYAEKKEKEEALKKMAPDATEPIQPSGKWTVHSKNLEYYIAKSGGKPVAYIATTSGKGYSSFIQMLVSLDTDMRIRDVNILSFNETPGLGDQILEKSFIGQFKGKSLPQIVLIKGETKDNIQAISGATISSRGVTNGVKDAVQMLVEKYGPGMKTAVQEAKP